MSAETAVQDQGLVIPLIDFSLFLHGSPAERASTARAVLHGFQTAGFVYLARHAIPPAAVAAVFARSAAFFAQPATDKEALRLTDAAANRGYLRQGREKLVISPPPPPPPEDGGRGAATSSSSSSAVEGAEGAADLKESFEIGREPHEDFRNHWPAQGKVDGFREEMMAFFERCQELHVQVMRAIAMGLGLDETHFDGFVDCADNTLRLLHYPQVKANVFKNKVGQLRAGEHTDYGSVTLLFQDDRGGLQVRSPSGKFVDATPIPDTIVVNAGDLLARWSNDTIKSTIHRVVEPPHDNDNDDASADVVYPPRYSVAYFCNPNADKLIEAMPGTYADEADKKYEGITSGDYLFQRLAATY
ncbi:hypothetical protein BB8028_0003g07490 [Beauveria bassiana]|uniref:Fe2OG dioxygenase domain-containing protein n=1 Tax=Beauveria bassiana TaxID=176275 RepID=A0A2S7Y7H5_BEABA|nr:hypothetical protein BB8028_0003g07490 [Beauveria bassiana]